jgi:drug/metabolite transporter (DMT)-like permease
MRFFVAGAVLYGCMIARGERSPSGRQWMSASLLGIVIFVFDCGLLFWTEQRVPSGIAAVMLATIPVFMALSEIIFPRTQKLTVRLLHSHRSSRNLQLRYQSIAHQAPQCF